MCPTHAHKTTTNNNKQLIQNELIKFRVPSNLKTDLHKLALERNIRLSALMRLIASDYLKRNKDV